MRYTFMHWHEHTQTIKLVKWLWTTLTEVLVKREVYGRRKALLWTRLLCYSTDVILLDVLDSRFDLVFYNCIRSVILQTMCINLFIIKRWSYSATWYWLYRWIMIFASKFLPMNLETARILFSCSSLYSKNTTSIKLHPWHRAHV